MKDFKSRLIAVGTAVALTVGLDQWTKQLAIEHLKGEPPIYYFGDLFNLTFATNTGAFLSLGENLGPWLKPILLNALPALLLIGLLVFIFRERKLNGWQTVALALIVGGGLSNIIDRLIYGHVVDMLHIQLTDKLQTGIFNVADMAIMAGMFIMLPFVFRKEKAEEEVQENVPQMSTENPITDLEDEGVRV